MLLAKRVMRGWEAEEVRERLRGKLGGSYTRDYYITNDHR